MNKKNILVILIEVTLVLIILFIIPKRLLYYDVVKNESITSFEELISSLDSNVTYNQELDSFEIKSPDDSTYLYLTKNFSKSKLYDAMIKISIEPFIRAGLDTNKLTLYHIENDYIYIGIKLNINDTSNIENPSLAYKKLVNLKRNILSHHQNMDHFGLDLGNGNMFEWAKKLQNNDKDIVIALNIEPFINSGVDLQKLEGWTYAKIPVMKNHKTTEVEKLIKVFNIK